MSIKYGKNKTGLEKRERLQKIETGCFNIQIKTGRDEAVDSILLLHTEENENEREFWQRPIT